VNEGSRGQVRILCSNTYLVTAALRESDVATYRDFLESRYLNPGTLESLNPRTLLVLEE
jgi:hypothetical protein